MKWHFLATLCLAPVLPTAASAQQTVAQRLDSIESKLDRLTTAVEKLIETKTAKAEDVLSKDCNVCRQKQCTQGVCQTYACPNGQCNVNAKSPTILLRFTAEDTLGRTHEVYATDTADAVKRLNKKLTEEHCRSAVVVSPQPQTYAPQYDAPQNCGPRG